MPLCLRCGGAHILASSMQRRHSCASASTDRKACHDANLSSVRS
jgi:hypothetical protein